MSQLLKERRSETVNTHDRLSWWDRRACRGVHFSRFSAECLFGEKRRAYLVREAEVRSLCHQCPVYHECHDWILSYSKLNDPCTFHIVAAMTPAERDAYRDGRVVAIRPGRRSKSIVTS